MEEETKDFLKKLIKMNWIMFTLTITHIEITT
jgi:hypothetical protein